MRSNASTYSQGTMMKNLFALTAGAASLLTAGVAAAQDGHMMDGGLFGMGWMGGYGGLWIAVPLVLAVFGFVAWAERQKHK
jgi:hypothetical protein